MRGHLDRHSWTETNSSWSYAQNVQEASISLLCCHNSTCLPVNLPAKESQPLRPEAQENFDDCTAESVEREEGLWKNSARNRKELTTCLVNHLWTVSRQTQAQALKLLQTMNETTQRGNANELIQHERFLSATDQNIKKSRDNRIKETTRKLNELLGTTTWDSSQATTKDRFVLQTKLHNVYLQRTSTRQNATNIFSTKQHNITNTCTYGTPNHRESKPDKVNYNNRDRDHSTTANEKRSSTKNTTSTQT